MTAAPGRGPMPERLLLIPDPLTEAEVAEIRRRFTAALAAGRIQVLDIEPVVYGPPRTRWQRIRHRLGLRPHGRHRRPWRIQGRHAIETTEQEATR